MASSERPSAWSSGSAYEPYVGRWSRLVAREFLAWLSIPSSARWLDIGCGTGALTEVILAHASPTEVLGIDPSEGYLQHARDHIRDPRARFQTGDALNLPVASGDHDAVVAGLVLNFVADHRAALSEMVRATSPGGTVAGYVWDYSGQMQLMRYFWDAAVALNPAARTLDEGQRFPICQPEPLRALFHAAGLLQVEVLSIDVPTHFEDFNDYWLPFLGGQFPAPDYAMSLDERQRAALRERIRLALPFSADGSIQLIARAWAVRGHRSRE